MSKKEKATFAMGCFWKPELIFSNISGVISTSVGFMGGNEEKFPNPTYKQICWRNTGYAEVVQITFDPKKTKYEALLKVFWENHNPTTSNRQGFDIGKQYRSAIFYHNKSQMKIAEKSKSSYQKKIGSKKIVTEITKAGKYFQAEDYHQKYLEKRGRKVC